jgi:hypothetical protein
MTDGIRPFRMNVPDNTLVDLRRRTRGAARVSLSPTSSSIDEVVTTKGKPDATYVR